MNTVLVDSSVWIASLRGVRTEAVGKLDALDTHRDKIVVGDLILMEVLMGARDDARAAAILRHMQAFEVVALAGPAVAVQAARNYRTLRSLGVTIRTGIDMLIGTFCILQGHALLQKDRDFRPMQKHLGLIVV